MNFKNILPILSLISLCKACSFLPGNYKYNILMLNIYIYK